MKRTFTILTLSVFLIIVSCSKKKTCSDGLKNQNEIATDCGGPCGACPSCYDGVQNQDETGIDCGGMCMPCGTCNDGKQNQGETSIDCGGPCTTCNIFYPDSGYNGPNILHKNADTLYFLKNTTHSVRAILPPGTSLKIRITNLQGPGYSWFFPNLTLGRWVLSNITPATQELIVKNIKGAPSSTDEEFGFQTTEQGQAKFEVFSSSTSTVPIRKSIFIWNP